jgi:hypothetical protein
MEDLPPHQLSADGKQQNTTQQNAAKQNTTQQNATQQNITKHNKTRDRNLPNVSLGVDK